MVLGCHAGAPRRGQRGFPLQLLYPPPTPLAWGLPPTLAPASPSYLKIIRLLGRRAKQTDAELSIISSGGLDGEQRQPPSALPPRPPRTEAGAGGCPWSSPARWNPWPYLFVSQVKDQGGGNHHQRPKKENQPLPPAAFQSQTQLLCDLRQVAELF